MHHGPHEDAWCPSGSTQMDWTHVKGSGGQLHIRLLLQRKKLLLQMAATRSKTRLWILFCSLIPTGLLGQMSLLPSFPGSFLPSPLSTGFLPQVPPDTVAFCWQYKKSLKILKMHLTHIFQTATTCWLPFLTKNLPFVTHHLNQESSLPMTSLVLLSQPTGEAEFGFHSPSLITSNPGGSTLNSGLLLQMRMELEWESKTEPGCTA